MMQNGLGLGLGIASALLLGMVFGCISKFGFDGKTLRFDPLVFFYGLLPIIIFNAGYSLKKKVNWLTTSSCACLIWVSLSLLSSLPLKGFQVKGGYCQLFSLTFGVSAAGLFSKFYNHSAICSCGDDHFSSCVWAMHILSGPCRSHYSHEYWVTPTGILDVWISYICNWSDWNTFNLSRYLLIKTLCLVAILSSIIIGSEFYN